MKSKLDKAQLVKASIFTIVIFLPFYFFFPALNLPGKAVDLIEWQKNIERNDSRTLAHVDVLERNAELGQVKSQIALAKLYNEGRWVNKNKIAAEKWLRKAAEAGDKEAQSLLGLKYRRKDEAEATKWLYRAAQQGDPIAQSWIGEMYWSGSGGLEKDQVQGYMWHKLGLHGEDAVKQLSLKMTPEQIEKAENLAETWKPTVTPVKEPGIKFDTIPELPERVPLHLLSEKECLNAPNDLEYKHSQINKNGQDEDQGFNIDGILCGKSHNWCRPADACGNVIGLSCNSKGDGPYIFVNKKTKKIIGRCSFWTGKCQLPRSWMCGHPKNY